VIVPDVAIPAARLRQPGKAPAVLQSGGAISSSSTVWTRNIVEPYMSIRSPRRCASTLTASAQASIVPVITGVPRRSPVCSAAGPETVPATSPDQRSAGRSSWGTRSSHHASYHASARMSYSGSDWLAEWWSST
jgi:hypothetical protein